MGKLEANESHVVCLGVGFGDLERNLLTLPYIYDASETKKKAWQLEARRRRYTGEAGRSIATTPRGVDLVRRGSASVKADGRRDMCWVFFIIGAKVYSTMPLWSTMPVKKKKKREMLGA